MVFEIYTFTVSRKVKPYNVRVCIGSEPITMELDTGASLSTIGEKVYCNKLSRYKLCKSNVKLRSYTGDRVPVLGSIKVPGKVQWWGEPKCGSIGSQGRSAFVVWQRLASSDKIRLEGYFQSFRYWYKRVFSKPKA